MTIRRAFALFLLSSCAGSRAGEPPQAPQLAAAVAPPARLAAPEYLPENARAVLRTIMTAHAHNMGDLVSAIMVLDYDRILSGAEAVVSDASLARPLTGDATELNALLPEKFFSTQDQLRREARGLADAARARSAFQVASAYGRLSEVCVNCHAVYRAGK
jgi:cytochrome c556